jgi:urea carboxylase
LTRWKRDGQFTFAAQEASEPDQRLEQMPPNLSSVDSPTSGSIWQVRVEEGQQVQAGDTLLVMESMKMEVEVDAPKAGVVNKLLHQSGVAVEAGQTLVWLAEN